MLIILALGCFITDWDLTPEPKAEEATVNAVDASRK